MSNTNKQFIAYGLTQDEASAAAHHLINIIECAPESITTTIDPTVIYSLQADEVDLVGLKAHATDQKQWSKLLPICRHMKANGVKFKIIK